MEGGGFRGAGEERLGKDCSLCKVVGLWLRVTVGRFVVE